MTLTQTIAGGALLAGLATAAIQSLPSSAFLQVHDIEVVGPSVVAERTKRRRVVADWKVSIVGQRSDAPSCQTISGQKLDEGWSRYEQGRHQVSKMHLDVWVHDPGCYARLQPGTYEMFVTWTPRDGTRPVVAYAQFEKEDS